ncbi:MAG: asparagine--tRNA ligase [Mollicutes bacterium]|jgi:asparaginyl-tRNA synthetase|nr:asparagine--tRNA ligase [Mollicutes bacterium]
MKLDVKDIYEQIDKFMDKEIEISGWIKNHRKQKDFGFIDFSDGTHFKRMQLIYDLDNPNFEEISKLKIGSAIKVFGKIIESSGKNQDFELKIDSVELLGDCPDDYPLQPKKHSLEFLREIAHLRPRSNTFQAINRIRSVSAHAVHEYFQSNGYIYAHTPFLTTADCEGSDQMFKVTTFDLAHVPIKEGEADFSKDLFGQKTLLTGSGQLHGETMALAYKKIYTFGPTFRTENSNTKTHANEFWMIEPEVAFYDLDDLMDMEEDMLKFIVKYVMDHCPLELEFCDKFIENGLLDKLNNLLKSEFKRIDHKEIVDILLASGKEWEFAPDYEGDIHKEHEKYITDYYGGPVFIKNWPKDIKAYYMKQNADGKTVAAVDLVVPIAGELIGGSQREEDYDKLYNRMKEMGLDPEQIDWYLDLRKFGGCIHSGFGMGFDRLVMYLTGVENIRDTIPYPRTPKNCKY